MKFNYAGKGIEITDSLASRLEKKVGKLDRYFRDEVEATVRMRLEKGARNICEVTIAADGVLIRAEESGPDMYQSIDKTADKLEKQIRRYRTKLEKRLRPQLPEVEEAAVEEEPTFELVRTKRFPIKPMRVEDAIAQMELLGHTFYMFRDADSSAVCVVYRRNDGTYGVLVAED